MKMTTVQIEFPQEHLDALRLYTEGEDDEWKGELQDSLQKIYEKKVPKEVRGYIEKRTVQNPERAGRASRQRNQSVNRQEPEQLPASPSSPGFGSPAPSGSTGFGRRQEGDLNG